MADSGDLDSLRARIDDIDRQLLGLLSERIDCATSVNRIKSDQGKPLHDPQREVQMLKRAKDSAPAGLHPSEAEAFLKDLLVFSRSAVRRRAAAVGVAPLTVAVVGVGMIGGSIAKALKRANPEHTLLGIDLPGRLEAPALSGLFDGLHTPERGHEAAAKADVLFLCAPPRRNVQLLDSVREDVRAGAIVTDVGGLKLRIAKRGAELFGGHAPMFVGGHPMAGKAQAGFEHSTADLFEGRPWVFTPQPDTPADKLKTLWALVASTGATPHLMSPDEHDRVVPTISHLPQLAAVALMLTVGGRDGGIAGPALREMTRLAESAPEVWDELLSDARSEVVGELQRFRTYLGELELALGLGESVQTHFYRARSMRETLLRDAITRPESEE